MSNTTQYILALDQNTTRSQAVVFDKAGKIVAMAQKDIKQIVPQPGWLEHDPAEIWSTQVSVASEVIAKAGIQPNELATIGITSQRQTTIVWDRKTGQPIHNAIVWECRRTVDMAQRLKYEGRANDIRARTGLVVDAYFSGTKIAWILDHIPGSRERARNGELAFGTVDSWLLWKLTGGRLHLTDVSNASRTMLYNIHKLDWDDTLLDCMDIPRAMLPEVKASASMYGETDAHHLGAAIPVSAMVGTQQAATFGQTCFQLGSTKNTYGTGCFMLMNTGARAVNSLGGLLTTIGWQIDGKTTYALEGSVFIAGAAIDWLRDQLGLIRTSAESEALAASVPSTEGVYFVPAFVGLGTPYWDSSARGVIIGLTRGSNRAHIVRATLEAIAYQTCDVVRVMMRDAGLKLEALRVDGGGTANDWLMQFQADILGVPVQRPSTSETAALGAAYLAGLATHFWDSQEQIAAQWTVERTYEPQLGSDQRESLYAGWQRAVERSREWTH